MKTKAALLARAEYRWAASSGMGLVVVCSSRVLHRDTMNSMGLCTVTLLRYLQMTDCSTPPW